MADTVSLVFKNADGVTPDAFLEEIAIDGTSVADVKARLTDILDEVGPEGSGMHGMKLVFSGRLALPHSTRRFPPQA